MRSAVNPTFSQAGRNFSHLVNNFLMFLRVRSQILRRMLERWILLKLAIPRVYIECKKLYLWRLTLRELHYLRLTESRTEDDSESAVRGRPAWRGSALLPSYPCSWLWGMFYECDKYIGILRYKLTSNW